MIKEATGKLINHQDLTMEETIQVMDEIMGGQTTQTQTAAFLTALQAKKATITEITACASSMREHALKVNHHMDLLEIVGTGGDGANSFNISTTAACVCAAGGSKVAKHGNRAASSKSGAADVLEALGANISLDPDKCIQLLEDVGFAFFFAQHYHRSMKYVGPVRKELGLPTVFNILGPLTNPAHANHQVLGVYAEELVEPMAHVLRGLGVERGMVVYGQDKLDEISASAATSICEFAGDEFRIYTITPEDFGFIRAAKEDIRGGSPDDNARITRDVLDGAKGAQRTAVVMNAGAGLYIDGKAATLEAGIRLAESIIDSGEALRTLNAFVEQSKLAS